MPTDWKLRLLWAAVLVMGALILAGTAVLIVALADLAIEVLRAGP